MVAGHHCVPRINEQEGYLQYNTLHASTMQTEGGKFGNMIDFIHKITMGHFGFLMSETLSGDTVET